MTVAHTYPLIFTYLFVCPWLYFISILTCMTFIGICSYILHMLYIECLDYLNIDIASCNIVPSSFLSWLLDYFCLFVCSCAPASRECFVDCIDHLVDIPLYNIVPYYFLRWLLDRFGVVCWISTTVFSVYASP